MPLAPDIFPYRFRADYGTTFVYYEDRTIISYRTEAPTEYHVTWCSWEAERVNGYDSLSHRFEEGPTIAMTPVDLERFEAIPARD